MQALVQNECVTALNVPQIHISFLDFFGYFPTNGHLLEAFRSLRHISISNNRPLNRQQRIEVTFMRNMPTERIFRTINKARGWRQDAVEEQPGRRGQERLSRISYVHFSPAFMVQFDSKLSCTWLQSHAVPAAVTPRKTSKKTSMQHTNKDVKQIMVRWTDVEGGLTGQPQQRLQQSAISQTGKQSQFKIFGVT